MEIGCQEGLGGKRRERDGGEDGGVGKKTGTIAGERLPKGSWVDKGKEKDVGV
jgi:hypothetical protein